MLAIAACLSSKTGIVVSGLIKEKVLVPMNTDFCRIM